MQFTNKNDSSSENAYKLVKSSLQASLGLHMAIPVIYWCRLKGDTLKMPYFGGLWAVDLVATWPVNKDCHKYYFVLLQQL